MEFLHKPVLYEACLEGLNIKPEGVYLDGTVGGGGHASGIIQKLNHQGRLICLDQDEEALKAAKEKIESKNTKEASLLFVKSNFSHLSEVLRQNNISSVDGILLDIGVSSYQLDNPARGFSYNYNAPLDMRMDKQQALTAFDVVNRWTKAQIKDVIEAYGEEKWADRIAEFISKRREDKPIETTFELVETIKAAIPAAARREGPHPAKRTFQAIRIAVNDELGVLTKVIEEACGVLNQGGRFCIITFHSLEDRIVKNGFAKLANPCDCPKSFPVCICNKRPSLKLVTKKPSVACESELEQNPRSRSAKLRIAEKI